ncbi:MAG: S8 family serine peptidase [Halococcoides sp.]
MTRTIACLCAVLMVSSLAIAPIAAGAADAEEAIEPADRDPLDPDPLVDDSPSATVDVDAEGVIEVIVRFEDAETDGTASSHTDRTAATLQQHAADSQSAFDRFAAKRAGLTVERDFWLANAKLVTVDTDRVSLETLARVEHVRAIHENTPVRVGSAGAVSTGFDGSLDGPAAETSVPARPLTNGENGTYGLEMIDAGAVWETGQRGENATVAVLDSGVNTTAHPDLAPAGWAEFEPDGQRAGTTPNDGHGHGTHVSGTLVGGTDANGTHYGVAPNATLLHGKVMNDEGDGTFSAVVAGMEWAVTHEERPDVLSMSLGLRDGRFIEPISKAREAGVVVVTTSGNAGPGAVDDPGAVHDTLSVGAVDAAGDVPDFSSGRTVDASDRYGKYAPDHWPETYVVPDVTAPGVDVYSADNAGGYAPLQGTSMAAPHVAGVAALIRSEHPSMSEASVRERLRVTAEHPEEDRVDDRYGHGIVNASAALEDRDATVEGTITVDGDPAENVTVTAAGYSATTNASGQYDLRVPAGSVTVSVDPFGWAATNATRTVNATETATANLSTDQRVPEAELLDAPAHYARPTENVTLTYRTANVERYTADPIGDTGEAVTLYVNGTPRTPGENVTLGGGHDERLTVTLQPESDVFGAAGLEHTFHNGTHRTATTGPTRIHPDPVEYPADTGEIGLQNLTEFVESDTTVRVNASTPITRDAESSLIGPDSSGNPVTAGYVLDDPITLTMAPESAPIRFQNRTDNRTVGIYVGGGSQQSTIADLSVQGGGVDTAIYNAQSGSIVQNTTVENATVGIGQNTAFPARRLTNNTVENVDTVGIDVGSQVNSVEGNRIGASGDRPTYGIGITGGVTPSIQDNDIRASRVGVIMPENRSGVVLRLQNNTIEGGSVAGVQVDGGTIRSIEDNRVTGSAVGINTTATDQIANNRIASTDRGIETTSDGVSLVGNYIHDATRGVILQNATHSTITDTTVDAATRGVVVSESQGATVETLSVEDAAAVGLAVRDAGNVTVETASLEGSGLAVNGGTNVTASNVSVVNASEAVSVDRSVAGPSAGVLIETATVDASDRALRVANGSRATVRNVTVASPGAGPTVAFGDVDPSAVAVENLTLANGDRLSTAGRNVTLGAGADPGDHPPNREGLGPYLELAATGESPTMNLSTRHDGTTLAGVDDETLERYRYDDGEWSTIGASSLEGSTLQTAGIEAFNTTGVFAEEAATNLTVSNLSVPSTARQSDRITAEATITNEGSATENQTVEYVIDGESRTETTVDLPAGNSTRVALNWTIPDDFPTGNYTHGIHTATDNATGALSIGEEYGSVAGTIAGNHTDTGLPNATVTVATNGSRYSTTTATNGTFSLRVPPETYTLTAAHPDYETTNQTIDIGPNETVDPTIALEPTHYLGIDEFTATNVTSGEATTATATVTNRGATNRTTTVTLAVDGTEESTTNVSLAPGENATVEFTPTIRASGESTLTVSTANETANATIQVDDAEAESDNSGPSFGSQIDINDDTQPTTTDGTVQTPVDRTTTTATTTTTTVDQGGAGGPGTTDEQPTPIARTPSEESGPGFGGLLAVVAVLAGAVLLGRR